MTIKMKEEGNPTEGAPEGQEEQKTEGQAPEQKADESAELKERLKALEAKNQELESRMASTPATTAAPKITASDLRAMGETQRDKVAELYGMPFDEIVNKVEAQERRDLETNLSETRAQTNVRNAIDEAVEVDPQMAKLKAHIREFLNDIPTADKADVNKLAKWMKKATAYARGQSGWSKPATPAGKPKMESKTPGPNDEPVFEGESETGKIQLDDGNSIQLEKLIPDDKRKKMHHPTRDNALRISADFDQPPRMR